MVHTGKTGIKCYFFDTFCKNQTPEERVRIDTAIVKDYNDMLVRHAMQAQREAAEKEAVAEDQGA